MALAPGLACRIRSKRLTAAGERVLEQCAAACFTWICKVWLCTFWWRRVAYRACEVSVFWIIRGVGIGRIHGG
jgi:hypothetical protein